MAGGTENVSLWESEQVGTPRFPTSPLSRLLGFTFGLWCFAARAADTNAVLNGWLAAQTNCRTWQADFTQTRALRTLVQPLTATGHVWVAMPDRFRWELGSPAQTIALRQPEQLCVIYPLLKRAERYPLGQQQAGPWRDALALLDASFPRDRAEVESRFRVSSLTGTNGLWRLGLQPRSAAARRMITEIVVGLGTNDFALANTEMVFADGSRMRNDFTNAVVNAPLPETIFHWQPPADFTVTEPLSP